ncbi:MAG: MFS transporter [Coriobacteriales bacterium]|nr:MFS transporter [Coriobacteriales bacterium]
MKLEQPQKRLGPRGFLACALGINMLVVMAIDMYTPALPGMTRELGLSASVLNLTMFAFFLISALGTFIAAPLSDRLGRHPVLVGACVFFTLGSAGCALASGIVGLVVFRMCQAMGFGAVAALETALIKDSFSGRDLQISMTLLQSLIIVGPIVAPFLGSFILTVGGWRHIFWVLTGFGVVELALSLMISETLPADKRLAGGVLETLGQTTGTFKVLLGRRRFSSLAVLLGMAAIPYAAFLAVVSYILLDDFGMTYLGYSVIYAVVASMSVVAPFVYMGLSRKFSVNVILKISIGLSLASAALMLAAGRWTPLWFCLAFLPFVLAEGVVRPMSFVVLLDQPVERVGAASSLANLVYSIMSSLGTVLATLEWPSYTLGLGALLLACSLAMAVSYLVFSRTVRE